MAEIWGAAIAVVGAAYGANEQSDAAKSASRAQTRASDAAVAEQRREFDLMREDTAPYRGVGSQAINALGRIYGYSPTTTPGYVGTAAPANGVDASSGWRVNPNGSMTRVAAVGPDAGSQPAPAGNVLAPDYSAFFASPDYQFRREQGTQGIERSFAARGLGSSGNALAALADYNSGLAAGEFGNYFNRQAALAGIGQSAVNTSTAAGQSTAANIGNALINAGNARASGIADSANAWANAAGTIGGYAYDRWGRPTGKGG